MLERILKSGKSSLKQNLKIARRHYARAFRSFTPRDLLDTLRSLGIAQGDTILVHSSYDAFAGFTGKPSDVVAVLAEAVGSRGTVMMPTMPFTGTAVEYVAGAPGFDVTRTPSRMGLVSELFRRMPGVLRSVHPTHPVAVWGSEAAAIVKDHHLAATPCGAGSPFFRLLERRGKILLLGAGVDSLTFFHTVEEMLEARFPASPFTREEFVLTAKDRDGALLTTRTRLFEPSVSRRRNLDTLERELRRRGTLATTRLGSLRLGLVAAADVLAAVSGLADEGKYCYD